MEFTFLRALKAHLILLLTSLALVTVGCEDDDHDHDHDEEGHTDAEGFVLKDEDGVEVYREFEGDNSNGSITLTAGTTLELSVHFLDHDEEEIEHEEEEEEEGEDHEDGLQVSGFDSNVATVEVEEHEEGGDDHAHGEHEMAIEVMGVAAGETSFQLRLMHEGHADYTSSILVPVIVN